MALLRNLPFLFLRELQVPLGYRVVRHEAKGGAEAGDRLVEFPQVCKRDSEIVAQLVVSVCGFRLARPFG